MNEKPISCRWPQPAFQTPLGQAVSHPSQTANSKRGWARQPKLASSRPDRPIPGIVRGSEDPPVNANVNSMFFKGNVYIFYVFPIQILSLRLRLPGVPCHSGTICSADCCACGIPRPVHCLASCWQVWLAAWLAGRPAPGWQGRGLCGLRSYRLAGQKAAGCLAGPGLSFRAAFHRVADKNETCIPLSGSIIYCGHLTHMAIHPWH